MPVSVALVGPTGVGKSTLFRALTAGRGSDGVGMVDVQDQRLERLAGAVRPKKVVPAQVRLVDAPPGSRAQRIAAAREADALVEVARGFGPEPQPLADLEEIDLDLILTDLASVEKRLELLERDARVGKKGSADEREVLVRVKSELEQSHPLRNVAMSAEERSIVAPLFLASLKPVVEVLNVAEDGARDEAIAGRRAIPVSARLEAELSELDPAEAAEYRSSYGLQESGLDVIAKAVWEAGGLITFFTAGEPEVRAWPVERDAPAPVAAGVIHSDFEKNFIRAEVTSVDELVEAGSMEALRAAGKLRVEGRDYRVKDGDVVFFRVGK